MQEKIKDSMQADFFIDYECLAYPIMKEYDEIDYKTVYAELLPKTVDIIENSTDALYMYLHLRLKEFDKFRF